VTWSDICIIHFPVDENRDGSRNAGSLAVQPPGVSANLGKF